MSTLVRQAVSGAAFGAALCLSGVWVPSVVLGQLRLEDFRMLRMFLTASGASILILGVFSGRGLPRTSPRTPSPIAGVLGSTTDKYAGNIIGGLMQGLGMALAGACASTVLVQAAVGTHPGLYTLLGAAVGGFLHVPISGWVKNRNAAAATAIEQEPSGGSSTETSVVPSNEATGPAKLTIYEQLGISRSACVLAADLTSVGILAGLTLQPKTAASKAMDATFIDPIVGGLLVAAAQVVALLTRGSPLGVSNVFDEIGNIIWAGVDAVAYLGSDDAGKAQQKKKKKQLSVTGLAFAGGMMLAASATVRLVLSPLAGDDLQQGLSPARAVVGGLLIGLGSRVSGGCTSGHGISGLGLLSTSSLITTACMFGGGILFGHIL